MMRKVGLFMLLAVLLCRPIAFGEQRVAPAADTYALLLDARLFDDPETGLDAAVAAKLLGSLMFSDGAEAVYVMIVDATSNPAVDQTATEEPSKSHMPVDADGPPVEERKDGDAVTEEAAAGSKESTAVGANNASSALSAVYASAVKPARRPTELDEIVDMVCESYEPSTSISLLNEAAVPSPERPLHFVLLTNLSGEGATVNEIYLIPSRDELENGIITAFCEFRGYVFEKLKTSTPDESETKKNEKSWLKCQYDTIGKDMAIIAALPAGDISVNTDPPEPLFQEESFFGMRRIESDGLWNLRVPGDYEGELYLITYGEYRLNYTFSNTDYNRNTPIEMKVWVTRGNVIVNSDIQLQGSDIQIVETANDDEFTLFTFECEQPGSHTVELSSQACEALEVPFEVQDQPLVLNVSKLAELEHVFRVSLASADDGESIYNVRDLFEDLDDPIKMTLDSLTNTGSADALLDDQSRLIVKPLSPGQDTFILKAESGEGERKEVKTIEFSVDVAQDPGRRLVWAIVAGALFLIENACLIGLMTARNKRVRREMVRKNLRDERSNT